MNLNPSQIEIEGKKYTIEELNSIKIYLENDVATSEARTTTNEKQELINQINDYIIQEFGNMTVDDVFYNISKNRKGHFTPIKLMKSKSVLLSILILPLVDDKQVKKVIKKFKNELEIIFDI